MDREHTCCVTGHRDLTEIQTMAAVVKLAEEIMLAGIAGYTHFITGMAKGVDRIFAEDVLLLKKRRPKIQLVAAISHRDALNNKEPDFQRLLKKCDQVVVLSESYHPGVYAQRNKWMLEHSSRLIAAHDDRATGGTVNTMREAQKMGIEIWEAYLNDPNPVSEHPMGPEMIP